MHQLLRRYDSARIPRNSLRISFFYNTLGENLNKLIQQGLVAGKKKPREGPERSVYVYSLTSEVERGLSSLLNPELGIVSLPFDRLKRMCRREKGG